MLTKSVFCGAAALGVACFSCVVPMAAQGTGSATSAGAQGTMPSQASKHAMTLDDAAKLVRVGDPKVSPDGAWVAYTVSHVDVGEDKNVSELWMVSWDGKTDLRLTYGKESAGGPQWSPDGRWLAFTSSREGETKGGQVWVLDRRGGEAQQLTNVKQNLGEFRWSPDSKTLLLELTEKEEPDEEKKQDGKPKPPKPIVLDRYHFKQDVEGYTSDKEGHLYLFDVATKKVTKLTNGPEKGAKAYGEEAAEWSPDGKEVAFVSNQSVPDPDAVANQDVFVVSAVAGSAPRKLTTFTGQDEGPLAWTPDSKRVVYRQGLTPHYSIYDMSQMMSVAAAGGEPQALAPNLDQWVGAPVVSSDGKAVLTEVQDDRVVYVAELPLDGRGKTKRLTAETGAAMGIHAQSGHVALLWTTDTAAPEVYALEGTKLRKLTGHNDAVMATLDLQPAQDIAAKSDDGNDVHSLLTMPVGYVNGTKAPLLLWIHGGPTGQDEHRFDAERQLMAAHGYAVLHVNYRGSTGRGHAYSEAISGDWGNKEVKDLQAAVDGVVATGMIDADKMGVGGWSYGGILTDYMIASTTRFKAASSGAGMGNLLGLYGVDQYILQYANEIGPPWKNPDLYVKLSYPLFHADRIKTPTLFMGGDKDFNVPVEGGEQMFEALKEVGTTSELVIYPGEFHGFKRPSFIRDRYQRWFDWYDKFVKGGAAPSKAVPPSGVAE